MTDRYHRDRLERPFTIDGRDMGFEAAISYLIAQNGAWSTRAQATGYLQRLWRKSFNDVPLALTIERTSTGAHRLVMPDGTAGNWNAYIGIATLVVGGVTYYSATEYFEGTLPVGVPFTVNPVR